MSGPLGLGFTLGSCGSGCGFDFGRDALPAGATLTRGSAGSCLGADGVLRMLAADAPRFDHDPVTGARRGLLTEPAATNAISHPHGFAAPPWSGDAGGDGTAPVVTPGQPAPNGANDATRIDFARGTGGFSRLRCYASVGAPGRYCVSVWLRAAAPGPAMALRLNGSDGGTISIGTGWQRMAFSALVEATIDVQLILWSGIAGAPLAASVVAWGAQLEPGPAPTSFIDGARRADVLTLDWRARGVPDGPLAVHYSFDDGSRATGIQHVSGGVAVVPTDLPRAALRRIARA